jgi:hypothetical protein
MTVYFSLLSKTLIEARRILLARPSVVAAQNLDDGWTALDRWLPPAFRPASSIVMPCLAEASAESADLDMMSRRQSAACFELAKAQDCAPPTPCSDQILARVLLERPLVATHDRARRFFL